MTKEARISNNESPNRPHPSGSRWALFKASGFSSASVKKRGNAAHSKGFAPFRDVRPGASLWSARHSRAFGANEGFNRTRRRATPPRFFNILISDLIRHSSFVIRPLSFCCLIIGSFDARAQAPPQPAVPPPQDPLMTLMMSQPKIDLDGPVNATAAFDPPIVRPGQQTIYRVTFNGLEESVQWPGQVPAPKGLEVEPGAQGQILQMTGPALVPFTAFNSRVRAADAGQFIIPEFEVQVYGKPVKVPAARLEVLEGAPAPARPGLGLILELGRKELFVGQPVSARLLYPATAGGAVQGLQQVQLKGDGFIVDQTGVRQQIGNTQLGGANTVAYTYSTVVIPILSGNLTMFGQGFTSGMRFSGPIVITGNAMIPGGSPQYTLLESERVQVNVRPLPRDQELPGFTGEIGPLAMDTPSLSSTATRVGEPLKLSVNIRGDANLLRLVPPPPPQVRDWQVFAGVSNGVTTQPTQNPTQRSATFVYTLIPLTDKARATPPIPFSYFDPDAAAYRDLTIPAIPVNVGSGDVPVETQALLQNRPRPASTENEPVLSSLAAAPGRAASSLTPLQLSGLFPVVQLAPAVGFLGLWYWDRRRRYLAQHPEVVRRRRARRALIRERRSLRRAARSGDAPQFAAAAVNAMRAACAPHYPADPRAVVGRDVLGILSEHERSGTAGDIVRRFFASTDASRYANNSTDISKLLSLHPEVESVLETLEARL